MSINNEDIITREDVEGRVFVVANEIFAKHYKPFGNIDGAFSDEDGNVVMAEFLGDKVRICVVSSVVAMGNLYEGMKSFRNYLIDRMGFDEKLKWE